MGKCSFDGDVSELVSIPKIIVSYNTYADGLV